MSGDSEDGNTPNDAADDPSGDQGGGPAGGAQRTLMGHNPDATDDIAKPLGGPAPQAPIKRRGKGQVTIPGGSPQRGQFWGKVNAGKTKVGLGDEATVPISTHGVVEVRDEEATEEFSVADPITQELMLDEIKVAAPPPPKRKAPPRPPGRKPATRPPPPKRESDSGAPRSQPTPPRPPADAPPASRPLPPLRERPNDAPAADASPRSAPPRKRSEPPAPPPRSEAAPPQRSEPAPPKREAQPRTAAVVEATPPPVMATSSELEPVPLPAPSLRHRAVDDLCRAELLLSPEPARAARLHYEIGKAAEDPTAALASYRAALDHNPAFLPAIQAARELYLEARNMTMASKLFAAEEALVDEPAAKAMLLFAQGCAWLDMADDPDAAREAFRSAASLDPTQVTVLKALQHAELRAKDWVGLDAAVEAEANAVSDDPHYRAVVVVRHARLLERRLRKPEAAIEQYALALELDPQAPTALAELKRLLFGQARWQELVGAHEREAELSRDVAVRTHAYWNVSRIYSERLGATREAIAALEKAVAVSPKDGLLLDELARLYVANGDHKGAASAIERLAAAVDRPAERLSALHRLAELHHRREGKELEAVRWYEAALAVDPSFAPALSALDGLYKKTNNWTALAAMYVAEGASNQNTKRRAAAYAQAAEIFDVHLGRPDDAVDHYGRALGLDPHHEGAFKSLVRLHTQARRHRALIELYDRAVDIAVREDIAIAYMFKIAALYEDVLGEHSGATATYLRILDRQPQNLTAIHALQRTAETAARYQDWIAALDREVSLEKNMPRELMLQHRAAEVVYDHLHDADGALTRLRAVLQRDPKHAPALASVARIYDALGQPAELLKTCEMQLGVVLEGPGRVSLLIRMAEICELQLGDRDGAISWYAQAVAAEPQHALARAGLVRLLRSKGDHRELAKVLADEVDTASTPARVARAALLLGEVYEIHLSKPVDAVVSYKKAIEAVPGHQPALDALARVHAAGAAWKELADTLALQSESLGDARLAVDAQLRSASLRSGRLGRTDEAVAALHAIVADDPQNLTALVALEALHVEQDDAESLEALLSVEAEVIASPAARVAVMVEQGRLLEKSGADDSAAMRVVCVGVLAAERAHPWALRAMELVAHGSNDLALLADVQARRTQSAVAPSLASENFTALGGSLVGTNPAAAHTAFLAALEHEPDNLSAIRGLALVGSALGDAATMVDSYRREAAFTRDDAFAADLLVQSAAVHARLGDRDGAVEDADRAIARCPDHELAAQMLTSLLTSTALDALIERLTQAAHNAKKSARKVALWRQVGDLYTRGKHDIPAAISTVKRALISSADDVEAILQLARLHVQNTQHEEAAELLAKAVRIDDGLTEAHLELARIYTDHIPTPAKARVAIERVLRDEPSHRDALRMLLKLELAAGHRDEARATSQRLLDAAADTETRVWALVEIARVELGAKDDERAAAALHEAVVLGGIEGEAAKLYRRMAGDSVSWESYIKTLRAHLSASRSTDVDRMAAVYLEIARTESKRLNNPASAFRTLDAALEKVGDHASVLLERAEMLAATGRADEAAAQFASLVSRSPLVTDAWRGLTQVLQQQGKNAEAAIAASPLVLLEEATEVEQNLAAGHAVTPGAARPGSFVQGTLRLLSAGGAEDDEHVAGLLAAVQDGIAKAYPPAYELYGVRKGDRIKARSGHPVRNEIDRLAAVFGVEEVELYVHNSQVGDVSVELSSPPSVMVPVYLTELPDAQRVFLLARPLAAIGAGLHAAFKLDSEDVGLILAGAVRRLYPGFEEGEHDAQALAVLQEKLAPSWFSRGRVDEVVHRYYAEPVDAKRWAPSVAKTATRAAALLAGDLDACLAAMRFAGLVHSDKPIHKLMRRVPLLDDLLRFWVTDEANEARRLGGLV